MAASRDNTGSWQPVATPVEVPLLEPLPPPPDELLLPPELLLLHPAQW
jgi:hypothetical protein